MIRVLLVLLAAMAAGIAFVMEFPLLYAGASLLLLVALGLAVRDLLKERRREERKATRAEAADEDDDLRSLGIMEVRPREKQADEEEARAAAEAPAKASQAETAAASPHAAPSDPSPKPKPEQPPEEESPEAEERPEESEAAEPARSDDSEEQSSEEQSSEEQSSEEQSSEEQSTEEPLSEAAPVEEAPVEEEPVEEEPVEEVAGPHQEALGALVRALRLAAGAHAACLLAQEELALRYRVEALDAADEAPPLCDPGTAFSTEAPLLSASAARQPVTQVPVGEDGLAARLLGYYQHPSDLQGDAPEAAALVPVPLPDEPTTRFLLLDGPRGALEGQDALLKRFAALFAQVLTEKETAVSASSETQAAFAEKKSSSENGRAASEREAPARDTPAHREEPRPRREIIAEEMERSRDEGHKLALALVYLNRAETVAEQGEEEVRAAEGALRARLRQAAPEGRVERFGELTYGVFLPHGGTEAERWAVALQEEMDRASDPLAGGISVGLALMRGPEQPPAALRKNATNALREAYTTGTCTILE